MNKEVYLKGFEGELEKISKFWIQKAIQKPGALKKTLGVKKEQKIPTGKLQQAIKSGSPKTKKRALLAKTLKKLNK